MVKTIFIVILIGVIATFISDIGGTLLKTFGLTYGTPPSLIGKWIESVFRGKIWVDDIRTSPGEPVLLGRFLIYHYIIGIILASIFYLLMLLLKIDYIGWWIPVLYGVATTLIPAFFMFPGMGFAILGLKGPEEYLLLRTAILNHLFYGIGLALAVKWLIK